MGILGRNVLKSGLVVRTNKAKGNQHGILNDAADSTCIQSILYPSLVGVN